MMQVEVRHMLLLQAVAEEGSVTRAGLRLNLTQSALSHQLADLEQRLGTRLFHRVGKKMVLTPAGERLLRSATRILDELRHAEDEVKAIATEKRGILRLTTECYTCYHWLPALLARFQLSHPGVDVRIDLDATKRAVEALIEGSIDLAIISEEVDDKRVATRELFEDELVCITAPGHRLAHREHVTARDLAAETLLLYRELEDSTAYKRVLRPAGLEPAGSMQVPLTEAMVELVRAGMGVAVVPRWSVWPHIDSGAVAASPVTRRGLVRQWYAATLRGDSTPAYLEDFTEMLVKQPPKQRDVPLHFPVRRA